MGRGTTPRIRSDWSRFTSVLRVGWRSASRSPSAFSARVMAASRLAISASTRCCIDGNTRPPPGVSRTSGGSPAEGRWRWQDKKISCRLHPRPWLPLLVDPSPALGQRERPRAAWSGCLGCLGCRVPVRDAGARRCPRPSHADVAAVSAGESRCSRPTTRAARRAR